MGAAISECTGCRLFFVSVEAFDFHRVGSYQPNTRRCSTVAEMQLRGMSQDERGRWKLPASDKTLASQTPEPVLDPTEVQQQAFSWPGR